MASGAHVTSVENLESFRASLILYVSKARPALEEVSADVLRTRLWLENEQRLHWENQVRRRAKVLEQAQQALFSSGISSLGAASDTARMAVHRARQALEEAEGKLRVIRQWGREFDSRTDPLTKQLDHLHTVLSNDMLRALAFLTQALQALDAYAEVASPDRTDGLAPPPPEATAAPGEPGAGPSEVPPAEGAKEASQ
jgi:hypothetical protein